MTAPDTAAPATVDTLPPEAFKRLYPEQFYYRFISEGLRPDARPLGRARPTTIGINAISTADSSALVKIGTSCALAGLKLEVMVPREEAPAEGMLQVAVEMTAMCSKDTRPGRQNPLAGVLTQQLTAILRSRKVLDARQLCIEQGKAAWMAYLDVYILDANGSLLDVVLLAAVAALASLRLPEVALSEEGRVVPSSSSSGAAADDMAVDGAAQPSALRQLQLQSIPISVTCGMYDGQLIADPAADEEALMATIVTTVMDAAGQLLGIYKAGGSTTLDIAKLQECFETTKLRYKEVASLLQQALEGSIQQ